MAIIWDIPVVVVRKSQWAGAKALAKLIKPRKESGSRERDAKEPDRTKCAPDIPLPSPPPLLPPESPPPVPLRTVSDLQDGGHIGAHSPALTPINRGKDTSNHTSRFSPAEGSRVPKTWSSPKLKRGSRCAGPLGGAMPSAFSDRFSALWWASSCTVETSFSVFYESLCPLTTPPNACRFLTRWFHS